MNLQLQDGIGILESPYFPKEHNEVTWPPNGPVLLSYKTSDFLDKSCHYFDSTRLDFAHVEHGWTPGRVETWRGGLGDAYLLPALSSAGASLVLHYS